MTGQRSRRRGVVAVSLAVAWLLLGADPVGAASDSGASSRVVGRGNIVTSILGWGSPGSRVGSGVAPRCSWRTLSDGQIEWLVAVVGQGVAAGLDPPLLSPLRDLMDSGDLPDGDLQAHVCGTATTELRFVGPASPRSEIEIVLRRMITRLPEPRPTISPSPDVAVPIGQPVFVSIDREQWRELGGTITAGGLTASVQARPVGLRIITGDPASPTVECDGRGRPFDPSDLRSAASQARLEDRCVTRYLTTSGDGPAAGSARSAAPSFERPPSWLGTVTVLWDASWRVGDGDWQDLGIIPRTRLVERTAREVTTSIESRR